MSDRTTRSWLAFGCIVAVIVGWILITPPGAGADEADHLVRSGAVLRGELGGEARDERGYEYFELPDSYAVPDHRCYSFIENRAVSADCARPPDIDGDTATLGSRADEYPIWGHLTYGIATLLPGIADVWWARLMGAVVAAGLVFGAWHSSVTAMRRAALLLALTPMAWASFAIVNPSGFAIAGGIGLWFSMWAIGEITNRANPAWLFVASLAALVLPRRDGIIWASLIIAAVILSQRHRFTVYWHRLHRPAQVGTIAIAVGPVLYAAMEPGQLTFGALAAPLAIIGADLLLANWFRRPEHRVALALGVVVGLPILLVAATALRPGGWNTGLASLIAINSDQHLVQAVGVLGWLDTYLPFAAYLIIIVAIGMLAGAAILSAPRLAIAAGAILCADLAVSWLMEMMSGATYGSYWQGRYSLPLLVGIAVVLSSVPIAAGAQQRLARTVAAGTLTSTNIAAWAAARRWGVGVDGPLAPWTWTTRHSPVPIPVPLMLIAAASIGLLWLVWTCEHDQERGDGGSTTAPTTDGSPIGHA